MTITQLHHVQLAMPAGGEEAARVFYGQLLGLPEVPKPRELAKRGGCWFEQGDIRIHMGVEAEFRPAKKAHPAFQVSDIDAASKSGKVARAKRRTVNVPSHIEIYENRSIDHILVTFYSIKKS